MACQRSWKETAPTPRSRRAEPLAQGERAQRARPVAGGHLDLVPAAGREHELAGHAPGRALALRHEAADAPVARIGDAPVELHHAPAGGLRLAGRRRRRSGLATTSSVPGHVGQQRGEQARRRQRPRFGAAGRSARVLQRGAPLVADQPLQVAHGARVGLLRRRLRVLPSRGVGLGDRDQADREGGVLVGKDEDAARRGRRVPVAQARAACTSPAGSDGTAKRPALSDRVTRPVPPMPLPKSEITAPEMGEPCASSTEPSRPPAGISALGGAERPGGWPGSRPRARAVRDVALRPIEYMWAGSTLPAAPQACQGCESRARLFRAYGLATAASRAVL